MHREPNLYLVQMLRQVIAAAIALWICMLPLRAMVYGYISADLSYLPQARQIPELFLIGIYDFGYVIFITLTTLLMLYMFRRRPILNRAIFFGFFIVAMISLVWGAVNVKVVAMIGRPFNYQWFYYSGYLKSPDSIQAIRSELSGNIAGIPELFVYITAICLIFFLMMWVVSLINTLFPPRFISGRQLAIGFVFIACVYLIFGSWHAITNQWAQNKLVNPVASFFASAVRAHSSPALFTMNTTIGPEDFAQTWKRQEVQSTWHARAKELGIQNVILFVLESSAARYLDIYGGPHHVASNLSKRRNQAMTFKGIYTPAPATNFALLSLLSSLYPKISYQVITEEQPDIPLPTLSRELKQRGFRTGFFYSADLSYQKAREFLKHRAFDILEDYHDRFCENGSFTSDEWPFLNTSDDVCTIKSVIQWIDMNSERPFFAMVWTGMTHFPYFFDDEEKDFDVNDPYLNRYLNALQRGDEALGHLLDSLEARNMLASTLVVVVGDHGEAFNQHGTYGHASAIYDENVHVPLVLINPRLFNDDTSNVVGGLVDVGPTILDLMGVPSPGLWQGHSLYSPERPPRTYFFSPWSDLLFGFREGNYKLLFNATQTKFEIYDIAKDPEERVNLVEHFQEFRDIGEQRLAAWVQFQNTLYSRHEVETERKSLIGGSTIREHLSRD